MTTSAHPALDAHDDVASDTTEAPLPVLAQIALGLFGLVCVIGGPVAGLFGAVFAIAYGVPLPVLIVAIGAGLVFFTLWGLVGLSRR